MVNPPTPEQLKENDGGCDRGGDDEDDEFYDPTLADDFYKNGVRPQYLQVQRFLNYKKTNRGNEWWAEDQSINSKYVFEQLMKKDSNMYFGKGR